jgi:hypothetical protein
MNENFTEQVCPDCGENIKATARVCRFCRHEFGPDLAQGSQPSVPVHRADSSKQVDYQDKSPGDRSGLLITGLLGIVFASLIAGAIIFLNPFGSTPGPTPEISPAPSTAAQAPASAVAQAQATRDPIMITADMTDVEALAKFQERWGIFLDQLLLPAINDFTAANTSQDVSQINFTAAILSGLHAAFGAWMDGQVPRSCFQSVWDSTRTNMRHGESVFGAIAIAAKGAGVWPSKQDLVDWGNEAAQVGAAVSNATCGP